MKINMPYILALMVFAFVMQSIAPLAFNKPGQGITVAKLIQMELYGHHGAPPAQKIEPVIDHAAMGHGAHHNHHNHHEHHDVVAEADKNAGHNGHAGHEDLECALCIISVMAQHMGHHPLPDLIFDPVKYVVTILPEPVLQSFEKAYYHIGQPRAPPVISVT